MGSARSQTGLPVAVRGYPTHFSGPDVSHAAMQEPDGGPIRHGIEIRTVRSFFRGYLGIDPLNGVTTLVSRGSGFMQALTSTNQWLLVRTL